MYYFSDKDVKVCSVSCRLQMAQPKLKFKLVQVSFTTFQPLTLEKLFTLSLSEPR